MKRLIPLDNDFLDRIEKYKTEHLLLDRDFNIIADISASTLFIAKRNWHLSVKVYKKIMKVLNNNSKPL